MLHKPSSFSKTLVAGFVAAAFSLSAGAAFAQTAASNSGQGESTPSHSSMRSRIASNHAAKKSVKELTEELKQDDKQERKANAELSRAREKLARTTRELKQAQSQERHVASAERHTTKSEHQERQHAPYAEPQSEHNPQQSTAPSGNGTPQ